MSDLLAISSAVGGAKVTIYNFATGSPVLVAGRTGGATSFSATSRIAPDELHFLWKADGVGGGGIVGTHPEDFQALVGSALWTLQDTPASGNGQAVMPRDCVFFHRASGDVLWRRYVYNDNDPRKIVRAPVATGVGATVYTLAGTRIGACDLGGDIVYYYDRPAIGFGAIRRYHLTTGQLADLTAPLAYAPSTLRVDGSGRVLTADGTRYRIYTAAGTLLATYTVTGTSNVAAAWAQDGLSFWGTNNGAVTRFRTSDGATLWSAPPGFTATVSTLDTGPAVLLEAPAGLHVRGTRRGLMLVGGGLGA